MVKDKGFIYKINDQGKQIEFIINSKIYPLAAIYQAAYFFLDKVYIFLDGDPKKEIKVTMKAKTASADGLTNPSTDSGQRLTMTASAVIEEIAAEFYNELLNQLLREKVSTTNAKIREYVVSQALYNAVPNEVDELLKEVEEEDWQEDPLGISKTWESSSAPGGASEDKENLKGKKGKKPSSALADAKALADKKVTAGKDKKGKRGFK